jgi:hypothetical protein
VLAGAMAAVLTCALTRLLTLADLMVLQNGITKRQLPACLCDHFGPYLCSSKRISLKALVGCAQGDECVHEGRKAKGLPIVWHSS